MNWFNETSAMGSDPGGSTYDAALAFDPLLGELVLFGGANTTTRAATDRTWTYNGLYWTNDTAAATEGDGLPPALEGTASAWDPAWGGVLMTGGTPGGASSTISNQTWLFNSTGWWNLTSKVNNPANGSTAAPSTAFGSMVYDGALHEAVVVEGCSAVAAGVCSTVSGGTFALGPPNPGHTPAADFGTWSDIGANDFSSKPFPGTGSGGYGAELAYDPTVAAVVYFGGYNGLGSVQNATWTFNASGWVNITGSAAGCIGGPTCTTYYPAGSADGGMTWDGQLGEILLLGGVGSGGAKSNVTSVFLNGTWGPLCTTDCAVVPPPAFSDGELASNSSDVAPLLVEGLCSGAPACGGEDWVLEIPPQASISSVTPNPTEPNVPVSIELRAAAGTGSGPSWLDHLSDTDGDLNVTFTSGWNFTDPPVWDTEFNYASAGTYHLSATVDDFFDVAATAPGVSLVVNASLQAAPIATPALDEIGTPVGFNAGVSGGVPPYSYLWEFGDGNSSTGVGPSHNYTLSGTYSASVRVTDRLGEVVNTSFHVVVDPALQVKGGATSTTTDVGLPIEFVGEVSGGTGSYPHTTWTYGDGTNATAIVTAHEYSTPGTYTAAFEAIDSGGYSASTSFAVHIHDLPEITTITVNDDTPTAGTTVSFGIGAAGGTPGYTYAWAFGDGGTSTANSPTHDFLSAGTYTVTASVTDRVGATSKESLVVYVSKPATSPLAWLTHGPGVLALIGIVVAAVVGAITIAIAVSGRRRPLYEDDGAEPTPGADLPGEPAGDEPGQEPAAPPPD